MVYFLPNPAEEKALQMKLRDYFAIHKVDTKIRSVLVSRLETKEIPE